MSAPIQQLNIYVTARRLEDAVVNLADSLSEDKAYPLGDDLRRAATAVAHYVYQAHHYYSYAMKIEALHEARRECEKTQELLGQFGGKGKAKQLIEDYTTVIKQSWGLIKYFKSRQAEKAGAESSTTAKPAAAVS